MHLVHYFHELGHFQINHVGVKSTPFLYPHRQVHPGKSTYTHTVPAGRKFWTGPKAGPKPSRMSARVSPAFKDKTLRVLNASFQMKWNEPRSSRSEHFDKSWRLELNWNSVVSLSVQTLMESRVCVRSRWTGPEFELNSDERFSIVYQPSSKEGTHFILFFSPLKNDFLIKAHNH